MDTSGYVPRDVLAVCRQLEPVTRQYVFLSTVSVYRGWPAEPLTEDFRGCCTALRMRDPTMARMSRTGRPNMGTRRSGCEAAVTSTFGAARSTLLRPGVVLGPREYVGRLPWWLNRVAAGGRVLAPGSPDRSIQPVDVRDLAELRGS